MDFDICGGFLVPIPYVYQEIHRDIQDVYQEIHTYRHIHEFVLLIQLSSKYPHFTFISHCAALFSPPHSQIPHQALDMCYDKGKFLPVYYFCTQFILCKQVILLLLGIIIL